MVRNLGFTGLECDGLRVWSSGFRQDAKVWLSC